MNYMIQRLVWQKIKRAIKSEPTLHNHSINNEFRNKVNKKIDHHGWCNFVFITTFYHCGNHIKYKRNDVALVEIFSGLHEMRINNNSDRETEHHDSNTIHTVYRT